MFDDIPLEEHPEKNGWWINELESLGVDTKSNSSELRDKQDNSDLVEAIKQEFIRVHADLRSRNNFFNHLSSILLPYVRMNIETDFRYCR